MNSFHRGAIVRTCSSWFLHSNVWYLCIYIAPLFYCIYTLIELLLSQSRLPIRATWTVTVSREMEGHINTLTNKESALTNRLPHPRFDGHSGKRVEVPMHTSHETQRNIHIHTEVPSAPKWTFLRSV